MKGKFTARALDEGVWHFTDPDGREIGTINIPREAVRHLIYELNEIEFDFHKFLRTRQDWSNETFGEGPRTKGVIKHIKKELEEVEENPKDVREWVDIIFLALDGAGREGATADDIINAVKAKHFENEFIRDWPDHDDQDPNEPTHHKK